MKDVSQVLRFLYLPGPQMLIAYFILIAVVAVAVYFVAVGGSRRGPLPGESRAANRAILLAVVVAFAFALVVPVLILKENGEHHASTAVGVHLSKGQVEGRELFARSCEGCHTLKATNAMGRIGPDLDVRVPELPTFAARKALVLNTIITGKAEGLGDMPVKLYEGPEAEHIAAFVAAVAGHH